MAKALEAVELRAKIEKMSVDDDAIGKLQKRVAALEAELKAAESKLADEEVEKKIKLDEMQSENSHKSEVRVMRRVS